MIGRQKRPRGRHARPRKTVTHRAMPVIAATTGLVVLGAAPSFATFNDKHSGSVYIRMWNPPAAPSGLKTTAVSATGATVAWNAVSGATSYMVKWNGNTQVVTGTSANITGSPGTSTTVSVAATNADGTGQASTLPVTFATDVVVGFTLNRVMGLTAAFTWGPYAGAASYQLVSSTGQTASYGAVTYGTIPLSYNAAATITIKAFNSSGTLIATSSTSVTSAKNWLSAGGILTDATDANFSTLPADSLVSTNGNYAAIQQNDGNFVVYSISGMTATRVAESNTENIGGAYATLQGDGNFVIYNSANQPLKWTATSGSGNTIVMQDDGNLVIYNSANQPIWALSWYGSNAGAGANFMLKM